MSTADMKPRAARRRLTPEEYELAIRPANAIPLQHPNGSIRWVSPDLKAKCLLYGYGECEIVTETIQKAVPKAVGTTPPAPPAIPSPAPKKGS